MTSQFRKLDHLRSMRRHNMMMIMIVNIKLVFVNNKNDHKGQFGEEVEVRCFG